jgi:polysaccharide pyruvyl transferase CsaB
MPKVVISGYVGFKNNGDEAMLYAMLKVLNRSVPDLVPVVLSRDPVETGRFFCVQAVSRDDLRLIWKELGQADFLISGGGGLLQDSTGPNSILYYLGVVTLAKLLGKPVFFYGQGIGPVKTALGRILMRLVGNRVDAITVRDEESRGELLSLGVNRPPVYVTADPALGLDTDGIDPAVGSGILTGLGVEPGTPLLGVSVRSWKQLHDYKKVLARVCDRLIEEGWKVIFLPMHYPGDVNVSREISSLMENDSIIVERQLDFREMLSLMMQVQTIIGMRLHFLIFGALLNIPMVGVSYDPKVDRFLNLVRMPSGGAIDQLEFDGLLTRVHDVIARRDELRERLAGRVAALREDALKSAGLVAGMLKSRQSK